jgi:hypothetical protein
MRVWQLMVSGAAMALCLAPGVIADEGAGEFDAMMMEWMEKYSMPGEEHEYFEFFVGQWKYENTSYMGPEPSTSVGTAEYQLIMGGRYLSASYEGESEGQPFHGMGLSGYDRVSGECFNYWIDDHGTGVLESRGSIAPDGKGDQTVGAHTDPLWGPATWRMVNEITGEDTFTFSMYMASMGQPEKMIMQIKYVRLKAS